VPVERKTFRIEEMSRDGFAPAEPADEAAVRHAEVMAALTSLRALITASGPHRVGETTPDALPSATLADTARRTAREIAALRDHGFASMTRAAQELAAIVQGTEQATQHILQASEEIEQKANSLTATLKNDHEREMAEDIQDRTTQLFEACNFQDLTGQRIANVAKTLEVVQQHLGSLMQIWGDISDLEEKAKTSMRAANEFLNGPQLDGDEGHYSQADIDALFDRKPNIMSAA
jgi:chemotaxis protein CheZ